MSWRTRTTRTTRTPRRPRPRYEIWIKTRELWADGGRVFGALDGTRLVGATVMRNRLDLTETAFTSVLSEYRGRGVGQAIKAAGVLAFLEAGTTVFGTGGAGQNDASLGANRALGYVIEERWRSYAPPKPPQ